LAREPDLTPALDPEGSYREAMRDLIAVRFGALWRALPGALAGSENGVHDLRVASRRLRAALDIATGLFPASWFKPLQATVKEITAAFGEVRDGEVLIAFLRAERDTATTADGQNAQALDHLLSNAESAQAAARSSLRNRVDYLDLDQAAALVTRHFGPAAAPPEHAS
jgi:CHAD domain-containing protein